MSGILGSFNKIINNTTTEIIDSEIPKKIADVLNTLVNSTFEVVDDALVKIQDLTKEEKKEETEEP